MKSIISNEKRCFVCDNASLHKYHIVEERDKKRCFVYDNTLLHKHHIFEGRNRNNSEKYGLWVYLCLAHHNMSNKGVHFNKQLDLELKQLAQMKFQETYNKDFLSIFFRNYL